MEHILALILVIVAVLFAIFAIIFDNANSMGLSIKQYLSLVDKIEKENGKKLRDRYRL